MSDVAAPPRALERSAAARWCVAADLTPFLGLHFRGDRFDSEPGMPVEALTELVAYRELVTEVARHVFLERNPDRQRVPKGFTERLSLRLRQVEEGSSVPLLERPAIEGMLPLADEFESARDLISAAIDAAARGDAIPSTFPASALVHFNRLGQSLHDDESIELRSPGSVAGPQYTQSVRKVLLAGRSNYQRDASIQGWVTELDAERMRFQLHLPAGPTIPAPIDAVTFDEVKEALAPTGEGPQVVVSGVGVFDRMTDQLLRFDSVHELVSEDSEAVTVDILGALKADSGWLDGDGDETDPVVVQRARVMLEAIITHGVPAPRVYPVPDGGLQAEWSLADREVSVTVEPGGSLYVIAVNIGSGDAEDATLDSDDLDEVLRLVAPEAS